MIVEPLLSYNYHPVGLYVHAGLVIGNWGRCALGDAPKDARLFAHNDTRTFREVKQTRGRARWWKKRYVRFEIRGQSIYALHDVLAHLPPDEAWESLRIYAKWLEELRITPVSLGSTSKYIWAKSLPRKLALMVSTLPVPHDSLVIGGRQEVIPGKYDEATYWDIRGAYQSTMRNLMVGRRYRQFSGKPHRLRLSDYRNCVGFARAHIYLPQSKETFGPIPLGSGRIASFPTTGRIEGIYDLAELRLAVELGATVILYEEWIAHGIRIPFERWAEIIEQGRNLPNAGAAKIVKRMSNILWASFAASGQGYWVDYKDGFAYKTPEKRELKPQCRGLSAHIASEIRVRLFREALEFLGAGPYCIQAHTDGAIFLPPAYPNGPRGNAIGDWRIKYEMTDVTLLSAQAFRFTDKKTGRLRHIIAGCPPQNSERIFSEMLRHAAEKPTRRARRLAGVLYSPDTD